MISGGDKSRGYGYQCSSHVNGGDSACSVRRSLPRDRAECVIRECVEMDLLNPSRVAALDNILNALRPMTVDYSAQIKKLELQERNLMEAIKAGGDMPILVSALRKRRPSGRGWSRLREG